MTALAVNNAKRYSRNMENAGSSLLDSSTFSFAAYFWSTLQVKPMLSTGRSCLKVRSSLFARRGPGGEVSWRRARGLGEPGKAACGRLSAESGPEGPGSRRPRTSPRANFCFPMPVFSSHFFRAPFTSSRSPASVSPSRIRRAATTRRSASFSVQVTRISH